MDDAPVDSLAAARERDREDPLASFGERFHLPEELYMDGNSLGPISTDAERTLDRVVEEWRERGIEGWTDADPPWFGYAEHLGDRLAPLVGAHEDEVVVGNSTTVNIHTLIGTFLDSEAAASDSEAAASDSEAAASDSEAAPGAVLVNDLDFPTDHYAVRAQFRQRGLDPDEHLIAVESRDGRTIEEDDIEAALESHDVSIVFMPSVLYRSGQLLDVERITRAAHDHDALAGFDLAHSVGVVPHDLSGLGVDFAVWCHYKYLNAGPGAVAGLYVNREHFGTPPALAGWWGHDKATQFEMRHEFTPADTAGAWQIGTPPLLAAAPLDGALDVVEDAGICAIREKSLALTDVLVDVVDSLPEYAVGTPRGHERRGGHVAVEHPEGYRIVQALGDRGVVVDFRPPNVVRVCPSPLYTSFEDVWRVGEHLESVVADREYERFDPRGDGVT
ncbi:kynureninase [Halomarina salina]|uniref:Kynureninase n=1 Tax=Halomarina salina TaxID=1872699 RepID=A0ABD5RH93_9EURY|nr:kynureninase [Halomarina salina]